MKPGILVLACSFAAIANAVTLTMDEVPNQHINGLVVSKGGETFTFSDPGGNLFYNAANGGTLTFVQDPSICCGGESFTITFSVPVVSVSLSAAANRVTPAVPLMTINFFNGATLIASQTINSSLTDPFAEGQLTFNSGVPITSMTITPSLVGFGAIGYDNLTVTLASASPVPATSRFTLILMTIGIASVGLYAMRKKLGSSTSLY